jgi:hypothetical protein
VRRGTRPRIGISHLIGDGIQPLAHRREDALERSHGRLEATRTVPLVRVDLGLSGGGGGMMPSRRSAGATCGPIFAGGSLREPLTGCMRRVMSITTHPGRGVRKRHGAIHRDRGSRRPPARPSSMTSEAARSRPLGCIGQVVAERDGVSRSVPILLNDWYSHGASGLGQSGWSTSRTRTDFARRMYCFGCSCSPVIAFPSLGVPPRRRPR